MRTKAIREALEALHHAESGSGEPYDPSEALAEVDEIERVARLVSSKEYRSPRQSLDAIEEALAMCETITKEAP